MLDTPPQQTLMRMTEIFDLFQQALLATNSAYALGSAQEAIRQAAAQQDSLARAKAHALTRLGQAAQLMETKDSPHAPGTGDLVVLIRQVIRAYGRALTLPRNWWDRIKFRAVATGLYTSGISDQNVIVHARPWQPGWLADEKEDIDRLEQRRVRRRTLDRMLAAWSDGRITTYRSDGQKAAVDAVLNLQPGGTLLVTLPTGGGKSLCMALPAWLDSGGGIRQGGTTVVVVPIVALGIDQQQHVIQDFRFAADDKYRPHVWLGTTSIEERGVICEGISAGTLPLLYTSPEALLNNPRLQKAMMEAAGKGNLNWLVIDEAHMVELWGAGFRTEFQLLAALRQQLLAASEGRLRTLLLSATVSQSCLQTLTELFANGDELDCVSANQLRPEISYWLSTAANEEERRSRILEALYHLPRPAILYVTQPVQAEEWVDFLRSHGFNRLAAFTGKTASLERSQIMREWERNERDLMVANSAFGLGVDKEDVRTVIHAALPENIDRFYQEVGRGGRDGIRSVSLICTVPDEDIKLARSMSIQPRCGKPCLAGELCGNNKPVQATGNHFLLDLDAAPAYNPDMEASDTHRNWNEHVLLLMQRAGFLQIWDANPETVAGQDEIAAETNPQGRRWLHIILNDAGVTFSDEDFAARFEPHRLRERQSLVESLNRMRYVSVTYASGGSDLSHLDCLGHVFARIYPRTALACGGCPACRGSGLKNTAASTSVDIDLSENNFLPSPAPIPAVASRLFTAQPHVHVIWDGADYPAGALTDLLPILLRLGITQYVLPETLAEDHQWLVPILREMGQITPRPRHRILSDAMALGQTAAPWAIYPWPTAIVYPQDAAQADALYQRVKNARISFPLIQVVNRSLYLESEHGRFLERVNGRHELLESFVVKIQDVLETL